MNDPLITTSAPVPEEIKATPKESVQTNVQEESFGDTLIKVIIDIIARIGKLPSPTGNKNPTLKGKKINFSFNIKAEDLNPSNIVNKVANGVQNVSNTVQAATEKATTAVQQAQSFTENAVEKAQNVAQKAVEAKDKAVQTVQAATNTTEHKDPEEPKQA